MSRKNILLALSQGIWAIQPEFAKANGLLVQRALKGEKVFEKDAEDEAELIAYSVESSGAVAFGGKHNPFENAQPRSTAVIGVCGPIMKYDNCGDPGTKTYGALLEKAKQHPNINSIILLCDSPGGTVDGTMELADLVKAAASQKPVIAFVDTMAASAMYWIASGASEIICINETASVGSIGTMCSFADMRGMWEKEGVTFHDIYADKSVDKNKDYHDALKGDYALIKQKLNALNENFLNAVSQNREGKINTKKENVLTGKMYLASDALAVGLIDSIGNFQHAVDRAQGLSKNKINPDNSLDEKTQNENMKKVTLSASHTALLAVVGAVIAEGQASVDVELTDDVVSKIESALVNANEAKSKAETDLATANTNIAALEEKVKILGAENPGATKPVKEGEDNVEEESKDEFLTSYDLEKAAMKEKGII